MTIPLTLILVVLLSASQTLDAAAAAAALTSSFAFPTFATAAPDLALSGDAEIAGAAIVLSRASGVSYANPVRFVGTSPGFSTAFGFSLAGAAAIVFSLVPNATDSPVLSVAYSGGSIEMVIGGEVSVRSSNDSVSYGSGKLLRCWIDYDGEVKSVEVRLSGFDDPRPANYNTVSYAVDLSSVLWSEAMIIGLSSRSGNSTVYSWDFAARHGAPYLMHSEPLDPYREPRETTPARTRRVLHPWRILLALLFALACGLLLALAALLVLSVVFGGRRPVAPVEYPEEHAIECRDEKIVLVGGKGVDSNTK